MDVNEEDEVDSIMDKDEDEDGAYGSLVCHVLLVLSCLLVLVRCNKSHIITFLALHVALSIA
jgi:hypothetical protein